jgi:N-acetylglucosaminyl-diphospho-decaprenol L-rhamnosyltransferase
VITLSIVSHQQASLIKGLLDDVARVASPLVSLIVITHNAPEPVPEWPASLASKIVTIHNDQPKGFGANHNAAFTHCTTPYFVVMNPDLHLMDDPFEKLVALVSARRPAGGSRGVGMAAPWIVTANGVPEDSARNLMTPMDVLRRRFPFADRAPALLPHWLAGMFLFLSAPAFRAVDGFDERYFMYCEDFDLCARLRLAGWDIEVVEDAVVVHDAQRASHRSRRHLAWHVESLFRMWTSSTFWRYRRLLKDEKAADDDDRLLARRG